MPKRTAPPPAPPSSRTAFAVALGLSLAGLAVSLWLARLHVRAHAGLSSFCAINDALNCDRVATSPYSVVLGLPVAVWGALGYATAAVLAALGLARRRPGPSWPAGLLFLVSAAAVVASIALAWISEVIIGSLCLMCAVSWALAVALLVAAWRAARAPGIGGAVRADLAVLAARPGRAAAFAAAALVAVVALAAAYPGYWKHAPAQETADAAPPPAPAKPAPATPASETTAADATPAAPGADAQGPWTIHAFSDYECPFCAISFERTRAQLEGRSDVKLVHRHFPLDPSCNPLLKRPMHPNACALARVAICAEQQGGGEAMHAALFRAGQQKRDAGAVARELGLDARKLEACLASPETNDRLTADIAEAIRVGVRVTPTYVVNGVVHEGQLPPAVTGGAPAGDR